MKRLLILLLLLVAPMQAQQSFKEDATGLKIVTFLSTAGAPVTGIASGSAACYISKNGGTEGTLTVGSTNSWTEIGHGNYALGLTTGNLDTAGRIDGLCTGTGAVAFEWHDTIVPVASYALNYEGSVGTMQGVWDIAKATAGGTGGSIGAWTSGIVQNPWSELIANNVVADSFGARAARTGVDSRPIDVSATGAVGVDFNNIEGGLGAAEIDDDASTEFATKLMGTVIEGAHTFKQSMQYLNSAMVGKYNSSAGTFNFRDLGDTKNRIVYTTTATSRATVTLSPD